jgi:UDPglucose--hexose-1-phosphate uridylyltransferase
VTGHPIPAETEPRRNGDPAVLVADSGRIRGELGWEARTTLREIVESAWHWHRLNPDGYRVAQEERFSPFWNRWINIAAHRGSRPWRGQVETLPDEAVPSYDPGCYLCPGNRRTSGEANPPYPGVWAFVNDFPTLSPESPEVDATFGPYRARTSRGICEVLNFSPDHGKRLSTMEVDEIAGVVDGWAEIYDRLGRRPDIRYVLIFENRGEIMGNSQPHPHGQVYAYGEIPDLIVEPQIRMFRDYRGRTGGACFVCEANRAEQEDGRRILAAGERFLAYVPYAAQFPYDVVLVPRAHAGSLLDLDPPARRELAGLLRRVLRGMDALFSAPYHYSMALVQAPTDGADYGYHMQVHLCSLLRGPGLRKHVVGADLFGRIINPSDPNHSAAEIRRAMRKGETP